MPTVSVIVPVYNVASYLPRCIDSILAQTYTDFELILVDDGSPDNSGAICDEYAAKDSRIRVIHQKNGGVSVARNVGIDAARGRFVAFIDSDDYVDIDYLQTLVEYDCDFSMCVSIKHSEDGSIYVVDDIASEVVSVTHTQLLKWLSERKLFTVWGKAYRKDILDEYNIRFRKDLCYGEDTIFAMTVAQVCKTAAFSEQKLYHYMKHPVDSLSKQISKNSVISYHLRDQFIASWVQQLGGSDSFYKAVSLHGKIKMKWAFMEIFEDRSIGILHRFSWYKLFFSLSTFRHNIPLLFEECSPMLQRILKLHSPSLLIIYQQMARIRERHRNSPKNRHS